MSDGGAAQRHRPAGGAGLWARRGAAGTHRSVAILLQAAGAMSVTMGKGIRRLAALVATAMGLTLSAAGGYAGYVVWQGNVHPVVEGRFYRAGQLSGPALAQVITTYHIRSILNLRGAKPGAPWYDHEIAVAQAHKLAYYDYRLSALRPVAPGQLDAILYIIQTAPQPMLVHCQAGADRTGLIAAVYRFALGEGAAVAAQELSLRYGHLPYLWSKTKAMDNSFYAYVAHPLYPREHSRDRSSPAAGGYEATQATPGLWPHTIRQPRGTACRTAIRYMVPCA